MFIDVIVLAMQAPNLPLSMTSWRDSLELFLRHGLTSPDFTASLHQITRGEISWCLVQRLNELAQLLMNLTTPILHPLASHPLAEPPENIGYRGLSFCAEQSVWIQRCVPAAQE